MITNNKSSSKKIILTGGKTGGHILPLIRINDKIKNKTIIYYGESDSLEEKITKERNIEFKSLCLRKANKISIIKIFKSFFSLIKEVKKNDVECVIATGGYVSFPVLLWAKIYKINFYLIEENRVMGLTNRLFSRQAKKVFLTFPLDKNRKNYILSFNPACDYKLTNIIRYSNNKKKILVLGGSLGSKVLIDLANSLSLEINDDFLIIVVAGRYKDMLNKKSNMIVYGFVNDLMNYIYSSDFVITRAGSATLSEVLKMRKPFLVIPSEKTKKNHQIKNAMYLYENNACFILREKDVSPQIVFDLIKNTLSRPLTLGKIKESQGKIVIDNSADIIIKEINI